MMSLILELLLASGFASAQSATIVNPDTFCRVEQFSRRLGKSPTAEHDKCNSLRDNKDVPIKSMDDCRNKALAKAKECMDLIKAPQIAVKGKFTERFQVSSKFESFTCELDSTGGSKCP
jgi:hypothetical protein